MRSRRDSMGSIPISSHSQREVAQREAFSRDTMSHTEYRARRDSIGSHPSQVILSSQPSHRDSLAQIQTHREPLSSHRDSFSSHRDSIHSHRDSISSQEGIARIHRDSISSLSSHSSNHEPVSSHLLHRSPVLSRDPRSVPSLLISLISQDSLLRESLFERETGQLHRERDMIPGCVSSVLALHSSDGHVAGIRVVARFRYKFHQSPPIHLSHITEIDRIQSLSPVYLPVKMSSPCLPVNTLHCLANMPAIVNMSANMSSLTRLPVNTPPIPRQSPQFLPGSNCLSLPTRLSRSRTVSQARYISGTELRA